MALTINGLSSYVSSLTKLENNLSGADADKSGALSLTEFETAAKTDTNLTGGLTADAAFKKLDANNDGQLSTSELTQGINLSTQIQSALIQGQELSSGSELLSLLSSSSGTSSSDSLFGGSSNDFSSLTSSLLGGSSSSSSSGLISELAGGSTSTSVLASLLGDSSTSTTATYIQQVLEKYNAAAETATDEPTTTTSV